MPAPQALEMPGARAPQGDRQAGRVEDGGGVVPAPSLLSSADTPGRHSSLKTSSSLRPNSSGSTRLTITAASSTEVSSATRAGQLDGLVDGHLLGRGDDDEPGRARVGEDLEDPVGLGADEPHLDQLVDGLGCGQLADDVAGGGGVHHDEVVVALAHLVAELPHGEDLAHAGGGGGHEVEGLGQRPDAARPPGCAG